MTDNLKPIIEQLKQTLSNREQLREKVLENFSKTKAVVESEAKTLVQKTKDSKVMNDYVIPLLQSERTEQTLKSLNQRLGQNPILAKLEKIRNDLIENKSAKAEVSEETAQTETTTVEAASATEETAPKAEKSETPKTRKSKASSSESKA